MPPRRKMKKFQQLTDFNGGGLSAFEKDDILSRHSSLCAAEQFHNDASLEASDRRASNNSKNVQWTAEGDASVPRSAPAPHGDE